MDKGGPDPTALSFSGNHTATYSIVMYVVCIILMFMLKAKFSTTV